MYPNAAHSLGDSTLYDGIQSQTRGNRETKNERSYLCQLQHKLLLKEKKDHPNSVIVSHTILPLSNRVAMSFQRLLLEVVATASALHFDGGQVGSETTVTRRRILALRDLVHAGRRLELQHGVFRAIFGVVYAQLRLLWLMLLSTSGCLR